MNIRDYLNQVKVDLQVLSNDNLNNRAESLNNLVLEILGVNESIDYVVARSYTISLVETLEDFLLASLEVIVPVLDEHCNEVILRPQEEYDNLLNGIIEGIIKGEKKVNYSDFLFCEKLDTIARIILKACKAYHKITVECFLNCENHLVSRNIEMHMLNGVVVTHIGNRIDMLPNLINNSIEDLSDSVKPMLYLNKSRIYASLVEELAPKEQKKVDRTLGKTLHKKEEQKLKEKLDPNVYDYKELNRMAKEEGFAKIRQKGDHGIFKRFDGSVIVIPQGRTIGKGLSIKIQKGMRGE